MGAVADEWRRRQGDAVMEDTSTLPVPIGAEIAIGGIAPETTQSKQLFGQWAVARSFSNRG